jgi:hypothetical protein
MRRSHESNDLDARRLIERRKCDIDRRKLTVRETIREIAAKHANDLQATTDKRVAEAADDGISHVSAIKRSELTRKTVG